MTLARDLPSLEQLENYDPDLVSRIFSSDGVLLKELYTQRRVFVDLEEIPDELISAAVASEDRRFYSHWGISLRDVIRAILINAIPPPKFRQGFSSITQQLARNLYDTIGFKKTITRKLKEMITAIQIEKTLKIFTHQIGCPHMGDLSKTNTSCLVRPLVAGKYTTQRNVTRRPPRKIVTSCALS